MPAVPTSPAQSAAEQAAIPLFHAAWLFAAGIALAGYFWIQPSVVLVAIALLGAVCLAAALRAPRVAWLPVAALWMLLGAWCGEMEPHPAPAPALNALSDDLLRTVEGTVFDTGPVQTSREENLDAPSFTSPTQRIDLHISRIEVVNDAIDALKPADGGLRLTLRWPLGANPQPFTCGERVRAVVRLLPPEVYHDPGVWSRASYLLDQGITASATVDALRIERMGRAPGAFFSCRLHAWQHAAAQRLLALPAAMQWLPAPLRLTKDDAAMLAAMVAGDRTYLTHSLRVGFERTGSFHMLVVSGLHLAIVAGFLFWIFKQMRLPRVPATLLTIAASFAYALFTGFATPVQRSLWMVTLYLAGRLVYRDRSPLNTIGFAALCLLVVSPRSLFDSSLQMTLLAVIAIAGVAAPLLAATLHPYAAATRDLKLAAIDIKLPPTLAEFRLIARTLAERIERAGNRTIAWRIFPRALRFAIRLVELVMISCVVELAMTLPMALYFHRITLFALPVNLLIVPILAVLIPMALVMLLLLTLWPAAAVVPALAVAATMHLGVGLVQRFGALRFGDLRIPGPLLWQSIAFCALLGAAIALARAGRKHPSFVSRLSREPSALAAYARWSAFLHRLLPLRFATLGSPQAPVRVPDLRDRRRLGRWQRSAAWLALLAAALLSVWPRPVARPRGALLVEVIDVGQGDSILVITPDGKTMLVDAGGFGGGPRQAPQNFDIGEDVVSPALWARGIRHLDVVALSHAHSDHMGGMPAVLRNFHPSELWVGNNPPVPAYRALLDEAASLHIRVRSFRAGDRFAFGDTEVHVLAPFSSYRPGPDPTNDDSMVLHLRYGKTSVLLEGDAEAPVEQAMLTESGLQSTLLKVGHHGSITSTRPEFLRRVAPQWAAISCGLHNRYGHPREEVLDALEQAHVRTVQTATSGIACFHLDGKTVAADVGCNASR